MRFTDEQRAAIERREGDLLLDAGAGSGKTTVLVERFAGAVLEDGVPASAILAITFTEKAAAELRDRVRARLRQAGARDAARAAEGAPISTIHGLCSRLLREHALSAGVDPGFGILDRPQSARLGEAAFASALEEAAASAEGRRLIATYGPPGLRSAVIGAYGQLRSRGQREPSLPPLPPAPDLPAARSRLQAAARVLAAELGGVDGPGTRVLQALDRLGRCGELLETELPWPGQLAALALPRNGGTALSSEGCEEYTAALAAFRAACGHHHAVPTREVLDRLLQRYGTAFAAAKREAAALDFDDLELLARDLLRTQPALAERLRARFRHLMVDEFQDTNRVQLELIELLADGNLFTVGDAQQSIYGFRHADVELFLARGAALEQRGARLTLQTNFRSRGEILAAVERAFAPELGDTFMPLHAGRADAPAADPRVELLVADKAGAWEQEEGAAAPWRLAEARMLARRIGDLIDEGAAARDVVVLMRATTDMRVYERALEERGVATYVIGGRGYWGHPQVLDLVAHLRALANPLDEEALFGVLSSPLLGVSLDTLVAVHATARATGRGVWAMLRESAGAVEGVAADDGRRLERFTAWFAAERAASARVGIAALVERAMVWSGYDVVMLAMPGGRRRLANVRKLMRLAREYEAQAGPDLRGFLEIVRGRAGGWGGDPLESEAPVEGEGLDAVRLMTIHRAKGLEFPVTCVADLGRMPRRYAELLRIGADGRIGLSLMALGHHGREPTLDHDALGEEAVASDAAEERRLFYVACTRARERLILSGAAKFEPWSRVGCAMGWLAPAFLGGEQFGDALAAREGVRERVRFTFFDQAASAPATPAVFAAAVDPAELLPAGATMTPDGNPRAPAVQRLSYSALSEYSRCGYRFYAERVLGLPAGPESPAPPRSAARESRVLTAAERGLIVHALLERLDFRRPRAPEPEELTALAGRRLGEEEAREIVAMIVRFGESELCRRLAGTSTARREQRFAYLLPTGTLMSGVLDVLVRERPGALLVVDYKSDRLGAGTPAALVAAGYRIQQLVYGLAGLRAGAGAVEVVHAFLELPEEPVIARYEAADVPALEAALDELSRGCRAGEFEVTPEPQRAVCSGCPVEGTLCSWPLSMTRREAPDRLF